LGPRRSAVYPGKVYSNPSAWPRAHRLDAIALDLLFERALAIREKALGSEHPDTAQSLDNLRPRAARACDAGSSRTRRGRRCARDLGANRQNVQRIVNDLREAPQNNPASRLRSPLNIDFCEAGAIDMADRPWPSSPMSTRRGASAARRP
jgi:hypothetical protein